MTAIARLTLIGLFVATSPCAWSCEIAILNRSATDLVMVDGQGKTILVGPNEKASLTLPAKELRIEFGAESFTYTVSPKQRTRLCTAAPASETLLRAAPGASLWLETSGPQPVGFPIRPASKTDLTGSPRHYPAPLNSIAGAHAWQVT